MNDFGVRSSAVMKPKRPTGVNVILVISIASLIVSMVFNLYMTLVRRMPVIFVMNAPIMSLGIAGIVGLWLMKRWGFWITVVNSIISLIGGFLNATMLLNWVPHIPILPQVGPMADILFLSLTGPVAILASVVYLVYLYKIRTVWRSLPWK